MDRDSANYGVQQEYGVSSSPYRSGMMSPADERSWSVLAHLSTFLNLLTLFLVPVGPLAAGAIWLFQKDRSPVVASHALRSVVYQVAWLLAFYVGWAITGFLTAFIVGILLWPVMLLVSAAPFVHAGISAYDAWSGRHRYL